MKQKLKLFFLKNFFPLLIVFLAVFISIVNFQPGTWLSGWDTLHPEFDLFLNLKRALSGAWQSHQGLGASASQAHAAEIPRLLWLSFVSIFLPTSVLRYSFFFLCLTLGPLGVYFFLEKNVFKNSLTRIFAFLGASFYLLNLVVLQHFYVPLEMFAVHYAFLPWLFLFALKYLFSKKQKYLVFFSLTTFLSIPMAHTPTLFYVYFLALFTFLLGLVWQSSKKQYLTLLKKSGLLLSVTLIINLFWLLPNFFFILNHSQEVINSKIHYLFTDEALEQSRQYSNLKDLILFKSFLFNWGEHIGNGQFGDLLNEWQSHLQKPFIVLWGYFSFSLVLIGIFFSFLKKQKIGLSIFPLFILAGFFLIILNSHLDFLYQLLIELPLFEEGLRFPFTKFSILFIFVCSVYFSLGVKYLGEILKLSRKKIYILAIVIFLGLGYYMAPIFKGNLISPSMKVSIPNDYFEMFAWFRKQPEGRIVKLPLHTFWGWVYHDWGYQGAGFLWFGLKQPLLDREFDRWSFYNEKSYQELSYAIYSQNLSLFENLLDKYQLNWILLDKSIIAPGNEAKILFYPETEEMLGRSEKISLAKSFGENLLVYKVNLKNNKPLDSYKELTLTEKFSSEKKKELINLAENKKEKIKDENLVFLYSKTINLNQMELKPELCSDQDKNQVFGLTETEKGFKLLAENSVACVKIPLKEILGNIKKKIIKLEFKYTSKENEEPFVCLFDQRLGRCAGQRLENNFFEIQETADNYQLLFGLDAIGSKEILEIVYQNPRLAIYQSKKNNQEFSPLIDALFYEVASLGNIPLACSSPIPKEYQRIIKNEEDKSFIEYSSLRGSLCDHFSYPQLPHNKGYLLVIESRNITGLPMRFCLSNHQTDRCDLYTKLNSSESFEKDVFLIPPAENDGNGYEINLNNFSIGKSPTINHLNSISILPIEIDWVSSYEQKGRNIIVLNQAYEKNWLALKFEKPFKIKFLKGHHLVNGWANGWEQDNSSGKIIFIFLPQLFQYFGSGALFLLVFLLIKKSSKISG
ncbi:MAG: hypothetical protein ABIH88_03340 [Patescibacteria group bacterium]